MFFFCVFSFSFPSIPPKEARNQEKKCHTAGCKSILVPKKDEKNALKLICKNENKKIKQPKSN